MQLCAFCTLPSSRIVLANEFAVVVRDAYLKAGNRTVYRIAQVVGIPVFKLGGNWRFRRTDLNRWFTASLGKNRKHAEH